MKHFKVDEFTCRCGCGKNFIKTELLEKLELARAVAGVPFYITSGYRCPKHNANVGGVVNSAHVKGLACDIAITDETKNAILAGVAKYFTRYGVGANFIHVDIDLGLPQVSWVYPDGANHVA